MQWIKHDTDANQDAKLQNVLLDYGIEGYGLYWYCIELIAGKIDKNNITFELEHDARIIARNVGSTAQKVEEMMKYFVDVGLFECSNNTITCLKLAKRLDQSMTSNPQMREIIKSFKSHDGVMMKSDEVMQDKIRSDKNREDIKPFVSSETKRSKFKYSDEDMRFAKEMFKRILTVTPSAKEPSFKSWANTIRLMRESDNRDHTTMWKVFSWANKDSFWCSNILSPTKLRKQFDKLQVKANETNKPANATASGNAQQRVADALAQQRAEFYGSSENMGSDDFVLHRQMDEQERCSTFIELDNGDWSSQ